MEQAVTHSAELLRQVFTGNIVMETADLKRLLESPAMEDGAVRGIVLRHRNKAEALLKEIVESDPECVYAVSLLVHAMEADARYEEAEAELAKGIERCTSLEDMAYLHSHYGYLMEHLDRDKAVVQYLKAIELDRGNGTRVMRCAGGLFRLGMERKARKFLQAGMRQLEPGDPLRTVAKKALNDKTLCAALAVPDSVPKLCRLQLRVRERVLEAAADVSEIRLTGLQTSTRVTDAERFVNAVLKNGNYTEVLIRIDDERIENYTGDTDPDGLALDRWIFVLNELEPGFELAQVEAFFKDKCAVCRHPQGVKSAEGLSTCPLDYEFREYMFETLRGIVEKVRSGTVVQAAIAETLKPFGGTVPEWIRRRYLKLEGRWHGHV